MKQTIKTLVQDITKSIQDDMHNVYSLRFNNTIKLLLSAYNDYQESERDGVGYLFDLNSSEDLICCIKGGLTAEEISELYQTSSTYECSKFLFGVNYSKPHLVKSWSDIYSIINGQLTEIIENVIAYPYAYESYKTLYVKYVTNDILGYDEEEIDDPAEVSSVVTKLNENF